MGIHRTRKPVFSFLFFLFFLWPISHSWALTFTVSSTLDTSDATSTDGICNDGAGNCTLRAAIQEANAATSSGAITIAFNIAGGGVKTITITSTLPTIVHNNLTIDGTTQSGSSCGDLWAGTPMALKIIINGSSSAASGFEATSTFLTIKGFQIQNTQSSTGIGIDTQGSDSLITCNILSSNSTGVRVQTSNRTVLSGNVANGNSNYGFLIQDSDAVVMTGNFAGTDVTGTTAVPNGYAIEMAGATNAVIGSTTLSGANLFSGNDSGGIEIRSSFHTSATSTGNTFIGNYFGTDRTRMALLPNMGSGISNTGVSTTIGGTATGAGNVFVGHTGNASGIALHDGATVQGNYFGTNASGTTGLGNGTSIVITGSDNIIGGTGSARNVLSGSIFGIALVDIGGPVTGNLVRGNLIGVAPDGTTALGNNYGVLLRGSGVTNNTIGGTESGQGNIITNSSVAGISTYDPVGVLTSAGTGNAFLGNSIYNDTGLGIDLTTTATPSLTEGPTLNDSSGHSGPNNFEDFPVLSSAVVDGGSITIAGTVSSTPSVAHRLEFFANDTASPTGYGEGKTFLGTSTITTNGSGQASFSVTLAASVTVGNWITATLTDNASNTSEFSRFVTSTQATSNSTSSNSGGGGGTVVFVPIAYPITSGGGGYTPPPTIPPSPTPSSTPIIPPSAPTLPPPPVSSDLQSQLSMLISQLQSLIQEAQRRGLDIAPSLRVYAECSSTREFTRDLTLGSCGQDVFHLQQFLVDQASGPAAQRLRDHGLTHYFYTYTQTALAEYQRAHNITPSQGYFGERTRGEMSIDKN